MASHDPARDDIAELADLVSLLAEHLERLDPTSAGGLAGLRERAGFLASPERGPTRLQSLSADSISVTEPDGSVRLLMAGQGTFPTEVQIAGQVLEHARPGVAGILFFNEEGDECGGLIFGGAAGSQGASLTFDKYHGDQVIQLRHDESGAGRSTALVVNDQPDIPLPELVRRYKEVEEIADEADRADAYQRLQADGLAPAQRLVAGRGRDGSARVTLAGADGEERIVLQVTADGEPSIRLLDAVQNVVWQAP